jgi:hypothetical protein
MNSRSEYFLISRDFVQRLNLSNKKDITLLPGISSQYDLELEVASVFIIASSPSVSVSFERMVLPRQAAMLPEQSNSANFADSDE